MRRGIMVGIVVAAVAVVAGMGLRTWIGRSPNTPTAPQNREIEKLMEARRQRQLELAKPGAPAVPMFTGADPAKIDESEQVITQIIPLAHVDAARMREVLTPLISFDADVVCSPSPNALVVTDKASRIKRLVEVIAALDKEGVLQGARPGRTTFGMTPGITPDIDPGAAIFGGRSVTVGGFRTGGGISLANPASIISESPTTAISDAATRMAQRRQDQIEKPGLTAEQFAAQTATQMAARRRAQLDKPGLTTEELAAQMAARRRAELQANAAATAPAQPKPGGP
jgi:hypothetical protein